MRTFLYLLVLSLPSIGVAKDPEPAPNPPAWETFARATEELLDGDNHPFEKAYREIKAGMNEAEVKKIMGKDPNEIIGKDTILWSFRGGQAMGEPPPVCYVYRVYFEKGKVTRTQKTISHCIYQIPDPRLGDL